MTEIDCLVYAETEHQAAELTKRLEATGGVASVSEVHDVAKFHETVKAGAFDVIVARLDHKTEETFRSIEALPHPRPVVVFFGPAENSDWILRAMRAGAREYLAPDVEDAVLTSLVERIGKALDRDSHRAAPAPVVGVVGGKGGVGATMVACQLASTLQQLGPKTCLVDLNLRRGDVAIHFDMVSHYSLAEVARTRKRIDASFMESLLTVHESGVSLIAAPAQPEDGELVRAEHVAKALRLLRSRFECIVLDLPSPWDDPGLQALDVVDALLVVTTPDLASLAQARTQLELLDRIGVGSDNLLLVANRTGARGSIGLRDAEEYLGRGFDLSLPNDHAAVTSAINAGSPLGAVAQRSALTTAMHDLGKHVCKKLGLEAGSQHDGGHGAGNGLAAALGRFAARTSGMIRRPAPITPEKAARTAIEGPVVKLPGELDPSGSVRSN